MSKHINLSGLKTLLEPLVHLINKKAECPDWDENDPNSSSYIAGRTHYETVEEQTISASFTIANGQPVTDPFTISLVAGESYAIEWDGVKYNCAAYIAEGSNSPSVGNGAIAAVSGGNGEPFFITVYNGQVMVFGEDGDHTLSLVASLKTIHKIDPKYLPEISLVGKEGTAAGAEIFNNYKDNEASSEYAHAEGNLTCASDIAAHAEGQRTVASGMNSHAEGYETYATAGNAHSEGSFTHADGMCSHAEGCNTTAFGAQSHAEGYQTLAKGNSSHASGSYTRAFGDKSTAIGDSTKAFSSTSFVAGSGTISDGNYSAVFGKYNINKQGNSETNRYVEDESVYHGLSMSTSAYITEIVPNTKPVFDPQFGYIVDGYTRKTRNKLKVGDIFINELKDSGAGSNPRYTCTYYELVTKLTSTQIQSDKYQVLDMWDSEGNLITVGKGTGENNRSNAHTLDWQGNAWYSGDVYVGSTSGKNKDEGSKKLATEEYVDEKLALVISNSQIDALFEDGFFPPLPNASGVSF